VQPHHVLLWTLAGQHLRLLAAAAASVQQPLARLRHPAALELLLHPADVDVVVKPVAALALELPVPARQPLDREPPAHLGDILGDLDQPRYALLDGVAPGAGGASQRPPEDVDGVLLNDLGHFDVSPALRARKFLE